MARAFRKWSTAHIGDLKLRAAISSELIGQLDAALDERDLSDGERRLRAALKMNLLGIAVVQRAHSRQRSRIDWLRDGDANTSFFQAKASARRQKNFVLNLLHNGAVVTSQEEKLHAVWEHFSSALGSRTQRGCCINFAALGINPIDLSSIDGPFSKDEVRAVVMDLNPRKAPGPDGYTALFFQNCWDIIKMT